MIYSLLIFFISALLSALTGILVFRQDHKNRSNQWFFLLTVFLVALITFNFLSLNESPNRLFYIRNVMALSSLSITVLYFFIKSLRLVPKRSYSDILLAIVAVIMTFLHYTDFTFVAIFEKPTRLILGDGIFVFVPHLILMTLASAYYLVNRSKNFIIKKQNRVLLIGLSPIIFLAPVTGFVLPVLFKQTWSTALTPIYPAFFIITIGYSIFRYGFFDIEHATMRTVGYALTVVTMAGIYVGLAYATSLIFFKGQIVQGISFSPLNVALALILVFIFQPIKRFFDRITNKIFYRNEYDREVFFKEFGKILSHDTDLKLLLRQTGAYIKTNLKAESVFFYLIGHGVYNGREQKPKIEREDIWQIADFYTKSSLEHESLVLDLVTDEKVKAIFVKHKIYLALPILSQKNISGFLFLGEHKSRGYSRRDVTTLEAIINELSIAIQNSLSVEEVRDLNETLQQRIKDATKELRLRNRQLKQLDEVKDEFLSIASHQLRTPLTSVKGYVDMLLEGDFGKLQPKQRDILEDVFMSSERMVQLINDFLNVSRIQTGKFVIERQISSLVDLVGKEIGLLVSQLEQKQLKIDWHFDETIEDFAFDEAKIRQVVINMLDNAIYYSKPDSNIKVALDRVGDKVKFTVVDTGIGVPTDEQDRLFSKFFRASNARQRRPDGTGVGLYLAKKIVDAHGGRIIFKSIEGKGSAFGFELPAK